MTHPYQAFINRKLYLVRVGISRSGKMRHYLILQVDGAIIEDCTSIVCKSIKEEWNNKLGSYDSREPYKCQDAAALKEKITLAGLNVSSIIML